MKSVKIGDRVQLHSFEGAGMVSDMWRYVGSVGEVIWTKNGYLGVNGCKYIWPIEVCEPAQPMFSFRSFDSSKSVRGTSNHVTTNPPPVAPAARAAANGVGPDPVFTRPSPPPPKPTLGIGPGSVALEAMRLVHGARGESYGHPLDNFTQTAKIWAAVLGVPVTVEQVALCMIGVKISRQCHAPKRDNWVDIVGYAEAAHMAVVESQRRKAA